MNTALLYALAHCETDVDGALKRFAGDEALYTACLAEFLSDPTMGQLSSAIASREWDEAFTAIHALKGLAGNMGFIPLFHAAGELVILIRAGRIGELADSYQTLKQYYDDIINAIRLNMPAYAQAERGTEHE